MKSLFNVLIFSSLCLLFQCTNVNEDEALVPVMPYEESCNSMNDIGYQGIEEGSMHNQLVLLMVENWSICSDDALDIADEVKRILNGYSKNVVEANNMDFEEFKSVVNGLDLSSFISELQLNESGFKQQIDLLEFSDELNQRIYGLIDLVEVMEPSQDVSTIQAAICEYYESNKIGLDGDDLVYFGAMVDVAMKSAEIWLNNDMGGQGLFVQFQNKRSELCTEWLENRWLGGVLLADATGVVSGAVGSVIHTGGATAAPNPLLGGLPTASAVGVITGAAASVNKAW